MTERLATCDELAKTLEFLPALVREARRQRRMTLREAADATGVSFNAISRFERGGDMMLSSAIALVRWLDQGGAS